MHAGVRQREHPPPRRAVSSVTLAGAMNARAADVTRP